MCVGVEAAAEISRMFEYQIWMLPDEASIQLLAEHAVECAVSYASKGIWERNNIVRGAVFGHVHTADTEIIDRNDGHSNTTRRKRLVAVNFGGRITAWDLQEICKKPGLRMVGV